MKHARFDYNRIQDPLSDNGGIPEDEPVFLIRAKDMAAPYAVRAWAEFARCVGADGEIIEKAMIHATRMGDWQKVHGCQVPDLK